jgi:hypothetical protein
MNTEFSFMLIPDDACLFPEVEPDDVYHRQNHQEPKT